MKVLAEIENGQKKATIPPIAINPTLDPNGGLTENENGLAIKPDYNQTNLIYTFSLNQMTLAVNDVMFVRDKVVEGIPNTSGKGIYFHNNSGKTKTIKYMFDTDATKGGTFGYTQHGYGNANATLPTIATTGANRTSYANGSTKNTEISFTVPAGSVGYIQSHTYSGTWFTIKITSIS